VDNAQRAASTARIVDARYALIHPTAVRNKAHRSRLMRFASSPHPAA